MRSGRTPPRDSDGRRLVVAVHDVAPSTLPSVAWLLGRLDDLGIRPRSLFVVPAEAGRPVSRSPELCALLRREQAAGSEVVLHGLTHRADSPPRGCRPSRLRARLFAGDAAEFLGLEAQEAERRLLAGRRLLADAGLAAEGFCAPCWLSDPWLAGVLRGTGFRFLAGMASLTDLSGMRRRRLGWLGYMGAGPAQEALITLAGRSLLRCPGLGGSLQVFLHPRGAERSRACRRALDDVRRLLPHVRLARYGDLLS